MTIVFSGSPVANVQLSDSFNTWRLTTNKILKDAASLTANNTMAGTSTFSNVVSISTLSVTRGTSQKVKVIGSVSVNTNLDLDEANIFDVTLGANNIVLTFTNPPASGFAAGATVIVRQDSACSRFTTFTNSVYTDGIPPILTANVSAVDVLSFFTINGGISYFGAQTMAAVN